jgi:acetoin utilization protein AcuB
MSMRVGEVMSEAVRTAAPDETADVAFERMREYNIHHLVVVDRTGVVGVVSERDLGGRAGASIRRNRRVDELMTSPVVTAEPEYTLRQAAKVMRGRTLGCLPVVRGRKLVGIMTLSDMLDAVANGAERPVPYSHRRSLRTELQRWKGAPQDRARKRR